MALPVYAGKPTALVLDTSMLAPGEYEFHVDGVVAGSITLVSPIRRSAAAITIENKAGQQDVPVVPFQDGVYARGKPTRLTLREDAGVNVMFDRVAGEKAIDPGLEALTATGAVAFIHADTQGAASDQPGVTGTEAPGIASGAGFRQRLALIAQANDRYPAFGGFCYGAAPTPSLPGHVQRSRQALMELFKARTGLEPNSTSDPLRYAWNQFLMGMYEEEHHGYAQVLMQIDPTLRNTASIDFNRSGIHGPPYEPSANRGLDFRYLATSNDQPSPLEIPEIPETPETPERPDYIYQGFMGAALLNMGHGDAPIWVEHNLAGARAGGGMAGQVLREAARNLALGVSGLGVAARSDADESDPGRDFLNRFAVLTVAGWGDHGVGILYSQTQLAHQETITGFGSAYYRLFVTLTRLGYTPRFITEEEISHRGITGVSALIMAAQTFAPPPTVMDAMRKFIDGGGLVLTDRSTTFDVTGMRRIDAALQLGQSASDLDHDKVPSVSAAASVAMQTRMHAELAGPLVAALGRVGRAAFIPAATVDPATAAQSDVTVEQINGGPDARYLVAVNDSHVHGSMGWGPVRGTLVPPRSISDDSELYDATEETALGPVGPFGCDLTKTTARVYALLAHTIGPLDIAATQSLRAGQIMTVRVRSYDAKGWRLRGVVPFQLFIVQPDGHAALELYRGTDVDGDFTLVWQIPINAPAGTWRVRARCQLDGRMTELPVEMSVARRIDPLAVALEPGPVVRQAEAILALLTRPDLHLVLPVFDSPQFGTLMLAATRVKNVLADRGVKVDILPKPALSDYWLGNKPTEAQLARNRMIDGGHGMGRIRSVAGAGDDHFSSLGGYRVGCDVILLDLAGAESGNPMVRQLEDQGMLWPKVSDAFPGEGRAVVQVVQRAFDPQHDAIVIQAAGLKGLLTAERALIKPPEDWLTSSLGEARTQLLTQLHVGGAPSQAGGYWWLTSREMTSIAAPRPMKNF